MIRRPSRRHLVAALTGVGFLAAGVAGCSRDADSTATAAPATTVAVAVAPVQSSEEPVTLDATGGFEAAESSDVAPETSGRVSATLVDVGDYVKSGAVLVRVTGVNAGLRLDEARAAVDRAAANVKLADAQNTLAQTTAARYEALLATGDVSRTVADQARTQAETALQSANTARASLAEARAQLALAEKAVADVVVVAPFSGFISDRKVSTGEYVQPSTPVVTLVKTDPLRLILAIPGVQAGQIARGLRVEASVDAYPGRVFAGEITAVNPVISPESRSFMVEVSVPNPQAILKPGMFAVATINQGSTTRALFVPRAAVAEDVNTDSWRVYVIDERNQARLRVVQLAPRQEGDVVRLVAGVTEGERVAVTNLAELFDTAPVTVGNAGADSEGGSEGGATSAR